MTALAGTFFFRLLVRATLVAACVGLAPTGLIAAGRVEAGNREVSNLSADEIKQLAELLQADWQASLEAKFSTGWDSNLLLSSLTREESGFGRASVEGMLWRPPWEKNPVELVGFLSATYRRMFSSSTMPNDVEGFFQGEARWRPVPRVRLSLLTQGYYLDTVLDLSTESERLASPLRNSGLKTGVTARWDEGAHWWTEATGTVNFSRFHEVPEDFNERLLGVGAGWQSGDGKLKVGVGVRQRDRNYRERTTTTVAGRPIAGTQLNYRAPEWEITVEQAVNWRGAWKITGALSTTRNEDNGSSFYDYRLGRLRAAVEWTRGPWEMEVAFEARRYRWDVQVAGIGLDPPRRRRLDQTFNLQLNREINGHLFVFVEADRECVSSNDPAEAYNQTVVAIGLGWKL